MTDNQFQKFWSLGYQRIIPIIPPNAEVSENSSLFKRIGTKQDSRGKSPGIVGRDGKWRGFDFVPYEADETDVVRWASMGAGVGIKTGRLDDSTDTLVAIDADTLNADFARIIRDTIEARLGRMPIRVGQYPKALYLCRVGGPFKYSRIEFGDERVEVLSDGRQFVAEGIHPKTAAPYEWPRALVPYDELPVFEPTQITDLLETLRGLLPEASKLIVEGATTDISQGSLKGSVEAVRKAVEATPNTSNHFPSRESYRDYGYAVKAALPDNEADALAIFQDWCARWQDENGEGNDPGIVEADWRRMKPPFRRGASWLYDLAEQYSMEGFTKAEVYFEPVPESTSPFQSEDLPNAFGSDKRTDMFDIVTMDVIMSREPPKFLIGRHFPEVSLGFLYSVPGAGKSFIALDIALHLSYSFPLWHGDPIANDHAATVLYIAAEGSSGFRNRIKAWQKHHGISELSKRFLMIERTVDFMDEADVDKLLRTVRNTGTRPCMVFVDTLSRAMPGADENLQKEMSLFVHACDKVKDAFGCVVLGVHHAGKNGDMRGSTVLLGAGDFVFKLERKQGASIGRLHCEKLKEAPDGWNEPYRFNLITLDDGQTSLVPDRAEISIGPETILTPDVSNQVLSAMAKAWKDGEPWGKTYHAKERFFERRMIQDFGFAVETATEIVELWEQTGVIVEEQFDKKNKRKGFKVIGSIAPHEAQGGVFD